METQFFLPIILGVVGVIVAALYPYLRTVLITFFADARTAAQVLIGPNMFYMLSDIARQAVFAARSNGLSGYIENEAVALKQYAMDAAQRMLDDVGLGWIDIDTIDDLIEAEYEKVFGDADWVEIILGEEDEIDTAPPTGPVQ